MSGAGRPSGGPRVSDDAVYSGLFAELTSNEFRKQTRIFSHPVAHASATMPSTSSEASVDAWRTGGRARGHLCGRCLGAAQGLQRPPLPGPRMRPGRLGLRLLARRRRRPPPPPPLRRGRPRAACLRFAAATQRFCELVCHSSTTFLQLALATTM